MNGRKISLEDPDQIAIILDVIHDCWFDVDDIRFDAETSVLTIKFTREAREKSRVIRAIGPFKKIEVPVVEYLLRIHHVKDYSIRDTEQVGRYDFNELEYDRELNRIRITTGVPIEIEVTVDDFEVSVEDTEKIVEVKKVTSVLN